MDFENSSRSGYARPPSRNDGAVILIVVADLTQASISGCFPSVGSRAGTGVFCPDDELVLAGVRSEYAALPRDQEK